MSAAQPVNPPRSLRVLSLDGGGVKGYSSLLILKRIFRTIAFKNGLSTEPLPCNVFDLMVGTSTGGLIAIMLGRLHMSIDDCLAQYEKTSSAVFGNAVSQNKLGKIFSKMANGSFYDVGVLEEEIRKVLKEQGRDPGEMFREGDPKCRVMVCVTRSTTSKSEVIRNYISQHPTQENYDAAVYEAATATAAAPMFFQSVKLASTGDKLVDGAMRRNNPINEALNEINRECDGPWMGRPIGCVVSIGTGVVQVPKISNSVNDFLKSVIKIMTDSEDTADTFVKSALGQQLSRSRQYFRFNVPQGMDVIKLDEWKETERMGAVATGYLSKAETGDTIEQCAKVLSDPDSAIPSVMTRKMARRDKPCANFVHRAEYVSRLRSFFWNYNDSKCQSFVLWGIGGVGKTQLALRLAEDIQDRVLVIWIRSDQVTNFRQDYSGILKMMSPEATEPDRQDNAASSTVERLGDFRDYLESHPSEWLLILDNCDDMDVFKDSIDPYLPTKGRILVTTRDPRFQGDFTAADDGINVQPMNESESRELLAKSIPSRFRPCSDDSSSPAGELLGLLGNLPLAIAQAAANIVDQQVSLAEYVGYCQAASGGLEALERPVRDRHARDTRNATQSVHLTWRVSFERLEESSPLSIVLLSYMACFHWDSVPRHVVRRLPEFSDLSDLDFRRCLARCVQLSLIEEYSTEVFPQLRMHPVVHEIAWAQLSGNASDILPKCSTALRALFPMLRGEEDEGWDVGSYLAPHALRVTQLSKVLGIETKDMPGLIRHLACYFTAFGSVELACALAETALEMALRVWGRDQCSIYGLRKTKIDCLVNYSKFSHALTEIDMALGYVESDSAEAVFGCYERTHEIIETLFRRYYALKDLTRYDEAYTEAAKIERLMLSLPDFHEPNEWARVMVVRHNMAHALARAGRTEAAMRLLERVIEDSRSPDGALRVNTTTYLASQNLMAELLLRGSGNNENITLAFQIYRSVYSVSLELLGVTNKDTWVAVNNVLATTRKHPDLTQGDRHFEERLVCSILESATAPGMRQTKGGDMRLFNQAVAVFFARVSTLLTTGKISMPDHVNSLLETFRSSFLVRSDLVEERFSAIIEYNTTGVHLQHSGRYQEAESLHCLAIQGLCEYYSSDSFQPVAGLSTEKEFFELQSVFHYNIMLSIARQGRVEEGFKYRKQHQRILEYAETEYGALTTRLEQDAEDRNIYEEATARIRSGTGSRGDKWWTMHEKEIGRAERRCGRIEEVSKASEDDTPEKSKTETDEVVGPPDRKEGKGKGRISRGMVALREKIKR